MTLSGRYFIPGPVEIDSEVYDAMRRPMMGHRGPEARELVASLQPGLQELFGTTRPVMLATGSATAMLEAAVRSGVRDQVLCIVSGTFGERCAYVAEQCGKDVVRLHVERGGVLEPELLDQLMDGPPVDAVTMVHSETSTGALAPVEELLARFRSLDDVITIVDCVSSVGGIPVESDRWGADFVFTGSQKAIGIPPGLAFGVASDRFVERARTIDDRGFYLDALDLLKAAEESRFPQTPALPIVYALATQLGRIAREGLADAYRPSSADARTGRSVGGAPWSLRHHGARGTTVRHGDGADARAPSVQRSTWRALWPSRGGRSPPVSKATPIASSGSVTWVT